ncbi:MAG: class I SAM-dependent methyltransferase [Phycisphaeraceae bacterium]|nr:class I SAM-dependent methyltransferase [Phycisphaeraceae bacterium]MBX3365779.1 class I SAM-dependent methyltransferase [Phycisphaeraceae bacterium]
MCMQHAGANGAMSTDEFGARFLGWLNGGAVMLMISVGHRTGLLDAMGRLGGKPATSAEIASAAGLSERYVREWLGAMVTGGVVLHKREDGTYVLPAAHAALLTRASSPNNLAGTAQWLAVLGSVEGLVVEAFRHGKGIPYEAYGERFHDVMAEESNQTTIGGLDEHILPLVPGLVERLERGARVVDVGCGKGLAMVHLASRFPRSEFVGVDLSRVAIEAGMREARARGLGNVRLAAGDVTSFGESSEFDLVTAFDAIHDQSRPAEVLANIRRILRPGGTFLMQDISARSAVADNMDLPLGPFTYTISCMHCMSVSLAGGGPGLGAAWGRELAISMLADAGFEDVRVHQLAHDIINLYYVCAG